MVIGSDGATISSLRMSSASPFLDGCTDRACSAMRKLCLIGSGVLALLTLRILGASGNWMAVDREEMKARVAICASPLSS